MKAGREPHSVQPTYARPPPTRKIPMSDTPDPRRCALLTIDVQNDFTSAT